MAGRLIPEYRAEVAAKEFGALPPLPPASRRRVLAPGQCEGVTSRPYRVKGLLADRDVGCLFGPPGAGKSLLGPLLAYRLAQGELFFGLRTRPGPTLYVAAEDESGMERRVNALRLAHGDASDFGLVKGVADLLNASSGDLEWLRAEVQTRRPALVVIDTLAMAFPGLIENDADAMGCVVAAARHLTEHGAAVLLIHHDSKARDGTPRGHSLLNGALDVAIALEPKDGNGVVRAPLPKTAMAHAISTWRFGSALRLSAWIRTATRSRPRLRSSYPVSRRPRVVRNCPPTNRPPLTACSIA